MDNCNILIVGGRRWIHLISGIIGAAVGGLDKTMAQKINLHAATSCEEAWNLIYESGEKGEYFFPIVITERDFSSSEMGGLQLITMAMNWAVENGRDVYVAVVDKGGEKEEKAAIDAGADIFIPVNPINTDKLWDFLFANIQKILE